MTMFRFALAAFVFLLVSLLVLAGAVANVLWRVAA